MALFVSDLHLGHPMAQAGKLAKFLGAQDKDQRLILVGDAIDDAALKLWPKDHIDAVREILNFDRITYLPGNHDSFMEALCGLWEKVTVFDHGFHYDGHGRKFLLTHGHQFDPTMPLVAPRWFRRTWPCTGRLHTKALSGFLKARAIKAAKDQGCDGVICGHTHHPDHDIVDGIEYVNCGDWFYSCTAVLERDGEFKLVKA